jgi:hypothetical protein
MSKASTINPKISHVHISGPYCVLKVNLGGIDHEGQR